MFLNFYFSNALALEAKSMNVNNVELHLKNYTHKAITKNQIKMLEQQIINNQKFINNYINKLSIELVIRKNSNEISFSNGNAYDCQINLSYKNLNKPVLLLDVETDILFTILHETAHCILTKDVMYQPLVWNSIPLSKQKQLQDIIDKQENKYLNNMIKVPPMLVYHEIFADTFAAIVLKNNDPIKFQSQLNRLIQVRKNKINDREESHLSVDALIFVKQLHLKNHKLKIEDIYAISIKITEAEFLRYLDKQKINN